MTTFQLPDLRGRSPISCGPAPGLSTFALGQIGGTETTALTLPNLPVHNHPATTSGMSVNTSGLTVDVSGLSVTLKASAAAADSADPAGSALAQSTNNTYVYQDGGTPVNAMSAGSAQLTGTATVGGTAGVSGTVTVGPAGGSAPFSVQSPFLAINWLVVVEGIYPSRS